VAPLTIRATDLTKRFSSRPIFRPVSFEARPSEIIAITGSNGAGKSTLLKMIGDVLSPTKGSCNWMRDDTKLEHDSIRKTLGYVAPYLELYDELTAAEHVKFVADLKGNAITIDECLALLDTFGLDATVARGDRHLRAYSSGMKQRVRCAMAFACSPEVLLLDEPTSNLDDDGTVIVLREAQIAAERGAIVFVATNDERERAIAQREIHIESV